MNIDWQKEKEDYLKYMGEHMHLLSNQDFEQIYSQVSKSLGKINTIAFTIAKKDGSKEVLFNGEEIQKAEDFAQKLLFYATKHELTENWLVSKRGFNLKKDLIEKAKSNGTEGRPLAHIMAIKKEYQEAYQNGDLDELHNWWENWLSKQMKEFDENRESSELNIHKENLEYRQRAYQEFKNNRK
jgi:hypothetical protein